MGASKHICPNCGRKMKQQFIGLFTANAAQAGGVI